MIYFDISLLLISLLYIIVICGANESLDQIINYDFQLFKTKFKRDYSEDFDSSESRSNNDAERAQIFSKNLQRIYVHNTEADYSNASFKLTLNKFSDLKHSEFVQRYTGFIPNPVISSSKRSLALHDRYRRRRRKTTTTTTKSSAINDDSAAPSSIDWREKKVVTRVKSQGACGGCWAFSASGALESHYAIKTKKLIELSEQQLIDCSSNLIYGNIGCGGGLMANAFEYITVQGIMEESSYPYLARKESCKYSRSKVMVHMDSYKQIYGEDQLKNVVGTVGPVTVAIYASPNFQSYASGVLDDPLCTRGIQPNHGVLVIGYGQENGKDYWLIKNSWGKEWGENGYVKLLRGRNMCNIEFQLTYPVL